MSKTRVVNLYHEGYDVYIGRGSKWGNPFIVGVHGNRGDVIKKYRQWIGENPSLLNCIRRGELDGKVLGCYCKPKPCHGDVLVELNEGFKNE